VLQRTLHVLVLVVGEKEDEAQELAVDTCMSCEEEDTCMSCEEEDTSRGRICVSCVCACVFV